MAEREVHADSVSEDSELSEAQMTASDDEQFEATDAETESRAQAEEHHNSSESTGETGTSDDEDYGISMDKVEAILNQDIDSKTLSPQMRRLAQRQEENTKRVEETVKGTKANPRWFVPLFLTLMVLGLIWIVVYYLAATMGHSSFPIPHIGQWNLLVGFGILMVGFIMTMWWH